MDKQDRNLLIVGMVAALVGIIMGIVIGQESVSKSGVESYIDQLADNNSISQELRECVVIRDGYMEGVKVAVEQRNECFTQRDSYENSFWEMKEQSDVCLSNTERAISLAEECTDMLVECRNDSSQ